ADLPDRGDRAGRLRCARSSRRRGRRLRRRPARADLPRGGARAGTRPRSPPDRARAAERAPWTTSTGHPARPLRPGAVGAALRPAALGGFSLALEVLALSGPEWRLGGQLIYAEESRKQRVALVERAGSIDLFIDGELQFRTADEALYHDGLIAPVLA